MNAPFTRRQFLTGAGATGAALAAGVLGGHYLAGASTSPGTAGPEAGGAAGGGPGPLGPLILVTLYGGNDGLNTLVPYTDPAYRSARPNLGYSASQVLALDKEFGLNPQLANLADLWKQGRLAVVRGVGYPNPSLSHFESMDIWQTANPSDGSGAGWLGRWLDLGGTDPLQALSVGPTLPLVMRGEKRAATAVTGPTITLPGPAGFQSAFAALARPGSDRPGLAGGVAASLSELLAARAEMSTLHPSATAAGAGPASSGGDKGGGTTLSDQLAVVAALINAGAPTRVYQVSLSSFDTHAGEKPDQERMLKELDDGVKSFFAALPAGHPAVLMTYSEFGRRPVENASGGTDHGAASVLFVAGAPVKGGRYYGEQPSLTQLDPDGNLVYNVDFRSVYATVLDRVLGADPAAVLGAKFPTLGFC
jgi:uncharacterized protein (DUF1501 family)